jgi:hypothetical protein
VVGHGREIGSRSFTFVWRSRTMPLETSDRLWERSSDLCVLPTARDIFGFVGAMGPSLGFADARVLQFIATAFYFLVPAVAK